MDKKHIGALLRQAADEVPDVDTAKIMQAIRADGKPRRNWTKPLVAAFLAVSLLMMLQLSSKVTVPPVAPPEPETYYVLLGPANSPYPDPLSLGYIIMPVTQ